MQALVSIPPKNTKTKSGNTAKFKQTNEKSNNRTGDIKMLKANVAFRSQQVSVQEN
jgi:hypothetical protein